MCLNSKESTTDGDATKGRRGAQLGQVAKTRHVLRSKKLVKFAGYSCDSSSLTNFEYKQDPITGNGNQDNLLEKIRRITSLSGFQPFRTTVRRGGAAATVVAAASFA